MDEHSWKRIKAAGLLPEIRSLDDYQRLVIPRMVFARQFLEEGRWPESIWSPTIALRTHLTVFEEIHPWAGTLRKRGKLVLVGGRVAADPADLFVEMVRLERQTDWLFANSRRPVSRLLAATFHHARFERIHPFLDGNGRVGRILLAGILNGQLSLNLDFGCMAGDRKDFYIAAMNVAHQSLLPLARIIAEGCGFEWDADHPGRSPFRIAPGGDSADPQDLMWTDAVNEWLENL